MDDAERARILEMTQSSRVVLFMKGNKMFPQCGFSAHVLGLLKGAGVEFDAHNILADQDLRQGLEEISNWPTYPQLYVNGELVGGCDIITQLHESGELDKLLSSN